MLSGTLPFSHGHTLGKSVMGITVLYCINFEERNEAEQTVQVMPEPLGVGRYAFLVFHVQLLLSNELSVFVAIWSVNRLLALVR